MQTCDVHCRAFKLLQQLRRCFPCHCSVAGTILRLERCPLAEVLQMEQARLVCIRHRVSLEPCLTGNCVSTALFVQMSLHGRNITDIAAEAFGPLGQLRRLSLSGNPLVRLPPGRFEGRASETCPRLIKSSRACKGSCAQARASIC